jgi:Mn2+/Fe2+ NRAMP family transporter
MAVSHKTTASSTEVIAIPPAGKKKLKWLGPGFLWMVSAAGSGELLFTPRVGSLYGYTLLWALLAAVILKWFINREIGRYTVCTGANVLEGFSGLNGPKNWALYVILIPQLFVAVTSIAGLAGSSATALILVLPGDIRLWTIGSILLSTVLVVWGKFRMVELVATILAVGLSVAAVAAAITVLKNGDEFLQGMIPSLPPDIKYEEILPWLGFMLSGAAGLMWYSFWTQKKGYGAAGLKKQIDPRQLNNREQKKLKGWISQMTLDNSLAVVGTCLITIAFLILGTELLKPKGLVPEEEKVAEVLGQLLGQVWGPVGFWFMIVGIFVGFWDTVLSDQDGFGRMFSGGSKLLAKQFKLKKIFLNDEVLRKFYVIFLVTILPIILYLIMGEPVGLLKVAGAIEAAHIPFVVVLILYLNNTALPSSLKPSKGTVIATAGAGLFFLVFAAIYVVQLVN